MLVLTYALVAFLSAVAAEECKVTTVGNSYSGFPVKQHPKYYDLEHGREVLVNVPTACYLHRYGAVVKACGPSGSGVRLDQVDDNTLSLTANVDAQVQVETTLYCLALA